MKCSVLDCELKSHALTYCRKHHARFIRHGSVESKYDVRHKDSIPLDLVKDTRTNARGYLYVNLINDIKFKARQRGKQWYLTHAEAFKLITAECTYCGFTPKWPESRVGIDRVNNLKHYEFDNCVSCCFTCNSAKGEKTVEEFKAWIKEVYNKCFEY